MIKELDLFGVFVPPLFAYAALAGGIWLALRAGLRAIGFYRWVWHPPLFNTALFVLLLSAGVAATFR